MELKVGTRFWWSPENKARGAYDEIIVDNGDGTFIVKNRAHNDKYHYSAGYIQRRIEKHGKYSGWIIKYVNR